MLRTVSVPVAELATVKPAHTHVLLGLLSFANADGRCWPSLRKLAEITGLKLSRVHRAIAEMESAGILTRIRRGAGTLYQLAERFLWRLARPGAVPADDRSKFTAVVNSERKSATVAVSEPNRQRVADLSVSPASGTVSPASETEGESKKEIKDLNTKREDGSMRLAPPVAALPVSRTREKTPQLIEPPQKRPAQPAGGPNPHARQQWLRTLNSFIGERLRGPQQWGGWEVVTKAMNGDPLAPEEKRSLDGLDRMMRGCGYRAAGGENCRVT